MTPVQQLIRVQLCQLDDVCCDGVACDDLLSTDATCHWRPPDSTADRWNPMGARQINGACSSFQSQNAYSGSETSALHWKSKLRNVWGQYKCISILGCCENAQNRLALERLGKIHIRKQNGIIIISVRHDCCVCMATKYACHSTMARPAQYTKYLQNRTASLTVRSEQAMCSALHASTLQQRHTLNRTASLTVRSEQAMCSALHASTSQQQRALNSKQTAAADAS